MGKELILWGAIGLFFGIWMWVAGWAKRSGLSKTIGIGGGFLAACFGLAIIGFIAIPTTPASPNLTPSQAQYEATKLYTYLERNNSFAFIDVVLRDDAKFAHHMGNLKSAVQASPVENPLFAPFKSCVEAADNLAKFAELRRIGKGQNEQSDAYRRPFWDALKTCKAAIEKPVA